MKDKLYWLIYNRYVKEKDPILLQLKTSLSFKIYQILLYKYSKELYSKRMEVYIAKLRKNKRNKK
jgi:hypothetical protein